MTETVPSKPPLGGQALIEGVMMRDPTGWTAAARRPDGGIETTEGTLPRWAAWFRPIPIARGAAALVETIAVGLRALRWSASVDTGDTEDPVTNRRLALTTAVTLAVFVGVFALLPATLARAFTALTGWDGAFVVAEAVIRLGLFLAYVALIGRSPAIRRTFEYHGAEHMVIAADEHDEAPTVAAARRYSVRHARCGTDFLLLVVVLAIVVFGVVGDTSWPVLVATRVIGLPVVAGLAYEVLRLARRWPNSRLVALVVSPGLAVQALTTREPDDGQIEVALAALVALREGSSLRH